MKKFTGIIGILMLSLVLNTCDQTTEPASTLSIVLTSSAESVQAGDSFTLSIELSDMTEKFFALSARITYAPSLVSLEPNQDNWIGNIWSSNAIGLLKSRTDTVYLSITQTAGDGTISGSGRLCSLNMTTKEAGNANFQILPSALFIYDTKGGVISVDKMELEGSTTVIIE